MLRRKRSHPPHRPPTSYSSVFAQIEEIGWKQLVSATGDRVSCLTFRVVYWVIEMHVYGVRFDLALHLQ
ncbi:hypothetical protein ZEAMMB73_Zm00001d009148 [Zea mays]|uniref:Uncharacterized protein n=1 Tax=Zea mays TaxID=4577 RepID=A0A1D6FHY2_MAIZE|nr:hypothetical protein ZEAMMB73_Zm00001d009148 [Zea mays]